QVEEKTAVPAAAHDANINGKPLIYTVFRPFVFCSHLTLIPACLKVTRHPPRLHGEFYPRDW
ncbi:MAG: hypothetical protein P4L69_21075, partial [Desulfosporosinus sp.]|nr:hypothetical protein [Desulfosporosinus sp.]